MIYENNGGVCVFLTAIEKRNSQNPSYSALFPHSLSYDFERIETGRKRGGAHRADGAAYQRAIARAGHLYGGKAEHAQNLP